LGEHYRVIVIGGGVVGCSVLYHLTKKGWKDVCLLERDVLTSGSTWHAAGGVHTLNGDPNVAKMQQYTANLYKEIEGISGQSCGLVMTGGVQLAGNKERVASLKTSVARGRYLGMDLHMISPSETKKMFPIMDDRQFLAGLWDPVEGHLDPAGTTQAYAKSAKIGGARIVEKCRVTDMRQRADAIWELETTKGKYTAEHVVNAGGLWAREVGRMVGLELPVLAMEHHYLITEAIPQIAEYRRANGKEVIHIIDFEGEIYTRQERDGILLGTYERYGQPWSPKTTPWDFSHELLPPNLDRIAPRLEVAFRHFPPLAKAGIKNVINGPFTFAPDGNPLIGPVRGIANYWLACGVMAGFCQGGGVGLALSNWMADGDPGFDVWAMDNARFGSWATLSFTNEKVRENYGRRFSIRFPNEELPAARPLRVTPLYERHRALGGQMGVSFGLEVPLWYAQKGNKEVFSWRRSTDFATVGAEAKGVRKSVGIMDISSFAKFEIAGKGARQWLDKQLACKMPAAGRMTMAPMLNASGKMAGDFTLANLSGRQGERYMLFGSGIAEQFYMRRFEAALPKNGAVRVEALGQALCGVSIAGPNARALLEKTVSANVSAKAFRFMDIREMEVGHAPCLVGRVTYTGDLGFEIWMKPDYAAYVWDLLLQEGKAFRVRPFGMRALNALRLEKNWSSWGREYRPIYGALEAGMARFVALDKNVNFVGRAAAQMEMKSGGKLRLVSFVVKAGDAEAIGDEPVWLNGKVVGWVTSGGYAHAQGKSMAQAYVPREHAQTPTGWEIEILGDRRKATLQAEPLFDPKGERMRG
jgi:dimethylglycine dehydrogenase